jgi:hypothetical protein
LALAPAQALPQEMVNERKTPGRHECSFGGQCACTAPGDVGLERRREMKAQVSDKATSIAALDVGNRKPCYLLRFANTSTSRQYFCILRQCNLEVWNFQRILSIAYV